MKRKTSTGGVRKRRCLLMTAVLMFNLLLLLPMSVYGTGEGGSDTYIFDEAGLFTQEQIDGLNAEAAQTSGEYRCGVYFAAVEDFGEYSSSGDVQTAAEDIYLAKELGWGAEKDGVLLLLSMEERDYALIAYGSFGNAAFTDYGKEVMSDDFLDDFAGDDWYGGCLDYLADCGSFLEQARNGQPYDVPVKGEDGGNRGGEPSELLIGVVMAFLPSAAFAMVVCVVFQRQMRTARKQKAAFEYIVDGKVDFRIREDRFTHTTQTRRKIQTNSAKSHGGGTHVNSRGFSGRSGKF